MTPSLQHPGSAPVTLHVTTNPTWKACHFPPTLLSLKAVYLYTDITLSRGIAFHGFLKRVDSNTKEIITQNGFKDWQSMTVT